LKLGKYSTMKIVSIHKVNVDSVILRWISQSHKVTSDVRL
jgi:hypothetical protein